MTHDQDYYPGANRERADKGAWLKIGSIETFRKAGLGFVAVRGGDVLVFRTPGKPTVDYFPARGRWKVRGQKKTTHGTATEFVAFVRQLHGLED